MELFTIVEDAKCILFERGVYKQVDVYTRNDKVYAKARGGFVRLLRNSVTSVPSIRWQDGWGFDKP